MGPTHVKINHSNLIHNYNLIKKKIGPDVKIMPIIKANAYGHGMIEVAKTLEKVGSDFFGVAFPEEGIQLREAGIKIPVLIMGAHLNETLKAQVDYGLDITITALEQIAALTEYCIKNNKNCRVHIKIDSGMNRNGIAENNFHKAYDILSKSSHITIAGIYSHFSSADDDDQEFTQLQLKKFINICKPIKESNAPVLLHIANSAGIIQDSANWLDMVRLGITLYGNPTNPDFNIDNEFREVMSFHSAITLIKEVAENEPVSYGRRYYTKTKTKIALVPAGYADGYNRLLTNNSFVLIHGRLYPVIGTVTMNQIIVDIGMDSEIHLGDEVVLFGKQENERITIAELAQQLNTIPYEITCWISALVERVHLY